MMKGKWTWNTVPVTLPAYWIYAALDPVITARLAGALYPRIQEEGFQRVYDLEVAVSQVLLAMEARGMRIDQEYCIRQSAILGQWEDQMRDWFLAEWGIENPSSDQQVIKFLISQGVHLTQRTRKGRLALDSQVLLEVEHPVGQALIKFREAVKTRSTYFDDFIHYCDGEVIHSSINTLGARTGRMSSSRPNLQNVPRSKYVRNAFLPREGNKLVLADFDQIELRLMAHYAQESELVKAVLEGEDLHTFIGRMIYNVPELTKRQRQITKSANFAKIYGAGAEKFALTAGIDVDEARRFMAMYDARFPGIKRFVYDLANQAKQPLHVITPYIGRKQIIDSSDESYKIVNYFIQGTAADVLKKKLVELANTDMERFMLIPIHDEIAFDVPEEEVEEAKREIATVMTETSFDVPLSVGAEAVSKWGEKYE